MPDGMTLNEMIIWKTIDSIYIHARKYRCCKKAKNGKVKIVILNIFIIFVISENSKLYCQDGKNVDRYYNLNRDF